jgi:multicomponent Na+:H+ antiporter subunit D
MGLDFFHNANFLLIQTLLIAALNLIVPFIFNKHRILKQIMLFVVAFMFFINVLNIDNFYLSGGRTSFELISFGNFTIKFHFEGLGLLFLTMISFLWMIALIYTISYIKYHQFENISRFLLFTSGAILTASLVAFSANLFTLFIFYEILTIVTMPLIVHGEDAEKYQQALKIYASTLFTNAAFMFMPLVVIINYYCGSTDFIPKGIVASKIDSDIVIIALLLMSVFGTAKNALAPFHNWLPSAMVASYPVSALFHAVIVVKVGLFCIYKIIIYIFGLDFLYSFFEKYNWLIYIPIITMIYASLMAMKQESLKKILAYSTISQLAFSIMSLFLFSTKGVIAAVMHMIAHSFSKITLFYAAGNIYTATNKSNISEMRGIGFMMPKTFICFVLASLSLVGIPPLSGFISKYYVIHAICSSGNINYLAFIIAILSSILTSIYLFKVISIGYQKDKIEAVLIEGELPHGMLIATCASALCSVFFFIFVKIAMRFLEFVY